MFKSLRNKILLLNMTLISVVMLSAFAAVYFTTWQSVQSENLRRLENQSITAVSYSFEVTDNPVESSFEVIVDGSVEPALNTVEGSSGVSFNAMSYHVPSDYSLSFTVEIADDGTMLSINSIIDMPKESYEEAVSMALAQGKDDGIISFVNKSWLYSIGLSPISSVVGLSQSGIQSSRLILFMDVTESKQTLRNLLVTLSVVSVVVLVVFYLISFYFSKRAVKPVIEAWEKQNRFIADASHELKTPLTIINANCDALLESGQETVDSQRKWIGYIQAGADRMASLTRELLALAKMDDANPEITSKDVSMSSLALDALRSMEAMASKRNLTITHSIEPDIVLKSDGEKISTIFAVLLENAVKYSDSFIDVRLEKDKRDICFTVTNDGKGIAKEDLPRVFDRFYRGDKSREGGESYGLGLSIAKSIIEGFGGKIEVESSAGGYTSFAATLPMA